MPAGITNGWHRPAGGDAWIMGVLNCTPDSFSDGGRFVVADSINPNEAIRHGLSLRDAGADIIDVGGESTRPGAKTVPLAEELERVIPVVRGLSKAGCKVSIDTMKAEVMRSAIAAGATLVNDVSALTSDPDCLQVVADAGVDVCLMHMQGTPESMQENPDYASVVDEVSLYFEQRIEACLAAGIDMQAIILDPGIGFGKRLEDNLALIAAIPLFKSRFGAPILLGLSRKSFLGLLTGCPVDDREIETAAADTAGILLGADIVRVHDVSSQRRAMRVAAAIANALNG